MDIVVGLDAQQGKGNATLQCLRWPLLLLLHCDANYDI